MPIIPESTYRAPMGFKNGHLQSIFPTLFRKIDDVNYQRERLETSDGDFVDLDWSRVGGDRLVILSHGLEGNSARQYIKGMARIFNQAGWDALPWNYRSCSGEANRLLASYHSGFTDDLDRVVTHAAAREKYQEIALIGFSIGGNITLKYAGEMGEDIHPLIKRIVAFSVPCDLHKSAIQLARPSNKIYMKRFLKMLHLKIKDKMKMMPGAINDDDYHLIKTFEDFDNRYTAPLNGFKDAHEYWEKASCKRYLPAIAIPSLLVNAANDPFLTPECFPVREAVENANFFLESPPSGGHTGFIEFNTAGHYWSEKRALAFVTETGPLFSAMEPDELIQKSRAVNQ